MGQAEAEPNLERLISDLSRLWPDRQDQVLGARTIRALNTR